MYAWKNTNQWMPPYHAWLCCHLPTIILHHLWNNKSNRIVCGFSKMKWWATDSFSMKNLMTQLAHIKIPIYWADFIQKMRCIRQASEQKTCIRQASEERRTDAAGISQLENLKRHAPTAPLEGNRKTRIRAIVRTDGLYHPNIQQISAQSYKDYRQWKDLKTSRGAKGGNRKIRDCATLRLCAPTSSIILQRFNIVGHVIKEEVKIEDFKRRATQRPLRENRKIRDWATLCNNV